MYEKFLELISKSKILTSIYIFSVHFVYFPSQLFGDPQPDRKETLDAIKNYFKRS